MRFFIFLVTIVVSSLTASAKDKQAKIEIKDDTVIVLGKPSFILDQIKKPKYESKDYFLKDLSGKKIALIQSDCYDDPTRPNPNRYKYSSAPAYLSSCYNTITFLQSKQVADFKYFMKQNNLAEFLIDSELIKDGTITQDAEDEFVLVNGNRNAEEKAQKLGGNTIIINNNGSSSPAIKNGAKIIINSDDE